MFRNGAMVASTMANGQTIDERVAVRGPVPRASTTRASGIQISSLGEVSSRTVTVKRPNLMAGSEYNGEWLKGEKEGKGAMKWANGATYVGGWKAGQPHGSGVYIHGELKYSGEWKRGRRHGQVPLLLTLRDG